jgi:hypothetical protein
LPESLPKFKAANDWLEDPLTSTADGSTVSAALNGMLPAYVEQQLGEQCIAITLEFGVTAALPTLNAMRADNWLRATSNKAASMRRHAQTKQKVRNAFLVREQVWEYAILERFRWTVERLVCSLPNMSTRNN